MAYTRKTRDVYVIQRNRRDGHGWLDVYATDNRVSGAENLPAYRQREPGYQFRVVTRRVSEGRPASEFLRRTDPGSDRRKPQRVAKRTTLAQESLRRSRAAKKQTRNGRGQFKR